MNNKKNYEILV